MLEFKVIEKLSPNEELLNAINTFDKKIINPNNNSKEYTLELLKKFSIHNFCQIVSIKKMLKINSFYGIMYM